MGNRVCKLMNMVSQLSCGLYVCMYFLSVLWVELSGSHTLHCLVLSKQVLIRMVILEIHHYGAKCLIQFTAPITREEDRF